MSAERRAGAGRRGSGAVAAFGLVMVLCCAIGPALIGAGAGSAIGGVLGVVVACAAAGTVALALHLRGRRSGRRC